MNIPQEKPPINTQNKYGHSCSCLPGDHWPAVNSVIHYISLGNDSAAANALLRLAPNEPHVHCWFREIRPSGSTWDTTDCLFLAIRFGCHLTAKCLACTEEAIITMNHVRLALNTEINDRDPPERNFDLVKVLCSLTPNVLYSLVEDIASSSSIALQQAAVHRLDVAFFRGCVSPRALVYHCEEWKPVLFALFWKEYHTLSKMYGPSHAVQDTGRWDLVLDLLLKQNADGSYWADVTKRNPAGMLASEELLHRFFPTHLNVHYLPLYLGVVVARLRREEDIHLSAEELVTVRAKRAMDDKARRNEAENIARKKAEDTKMSG